MNLELSDEALEFGRVVQNAFEAAGGDQLVQTAEVEPGRREQLIAPVLGELGAWDLDVRRNAEELEAAAALCRSVGYWAVPYPVAERLSRPPDLDVAGLSVVADVNPAAPIDGLDLPWAAVTLGGRRSLASARASDMPARKSAFVVDLDLEPVDEDGGGDVALALMLPCWTLLGMFDRAVELTCAYALERRQFGQSLASFQGVQFQLTDAEVERSGVEELAKYALWSAQTGSADAIADALSLRLAAVEAADVVFRVTHQLHGAIGFCDETVLSWLSRYSQPLRRLPLGHAATQAALTDHVGTWGLSGIFDAVAV